MAKILVSYFRNASIGSQMAWRNFRDDAGYVPLPLVLRVSQL